MFTLIFVIVWLPHNVVLVSAAWQNGSAVHNYIPAFFGVSSSSGHHRPLSAAPCAMKRFSLVSFSFIFFSLVSFRRMLIVWASQVVLVVKNLPAGEETQETGLLPGLGRSPGGGNGNPFQHPCLKNSTDRGVWQQTVHGVTKSQIQLSDRAQINVHISPSFRSSTPLSHLVSMRLVCKTRRGNADTRRDTGERPNKDTPIRCPSVTQGGGRQGKPNLLTP